MLASGFVALLMSAGASAAADANGDLIRVFMNHARVLKLDRSVAKVIIGNSDVADATVADSKTIVLTGRSFGTTNLVLLDSTGNAILDERVLVSIDEGNTVRVFRQTERSVYSCTPNCEKNSAPTGAAASATATAAPSASMAQ
ncbi:pilus assembly protein N-terminal domain-containing protein [Rhizobium sp. C4]|nr:pilus assembly protein N-terminal domain-containing protein [Rhizobium sp. C4]MCD2172640.1 pilus assembly protein N-terminal domain-containing protein [Rhizobium sp. C4]